MATLMQQTHGKRLRRRRRENYTHSLFLKHDKIPNNGLIMTTEIGALDTKTLDVLLGLDQKGLYNKLNTTAPYDRQFGKWKNFQ